MPECYIRGSTIKYLRIPDEVIDMVKEETVTKNKQSRDQKGGRGGQNQRNRPAARGKFLLMLQILNHTPKNNVVINSSWSRYSYILLL